MALLLCIVSPDGRAEANEWLGAGDYRIVVEVSPVERDGRDSDELVARFEIDLDEQFSAAADGRKIDLHSLQVFRQGVAKGDYPAHAQSHSKGDRPFRFYDRSHGGDLPTWKRYASVEALAGRPVFEMKQKDALPFGQRVFNAVGEQRAGTLVWAHTQDGDAASDYGIYFDLIPNGQATVSPPAGWIGDGGNRVVPKAGTVGPPGNNSGRVVDWNGDELPDLLYGISSGYVVVAENTGTKEKPAFDRKTLVLDADGKPIDVGYDSSPLSADWNGDGVRDLLVGAEKGCIVYFENRGSDRAPSFVNRGFVKVDGKMLLTPNWPIAELPKGKPGEVYPADYQAIPWVCDWDGDGDSDLLAGGFVTGQIFYFENVGLLDDGTPKLKAHGAILTDSEVLDTAWAAAPETVDLDGDGDLDLICGAKPMTAGGGDTSDASANLFYYENVGDTRRARLEKRPFPASTLPPTGTTLMAPVCDWNGDGLHDLLLVTRSSMQVFAVPNRGSAQAADFDLKVPAIPATWTNQSMPTGQFIDWNGDGAPDLINRFQISINDGTGFPHRFGKRVNFLAGKRAIEHPSPHGDENSDVTLHDLDGDGDFDCLYGAHSGHIWFHENRGSDAEPDVDIEGYRLSLVGSGWIQVGEAPDDKPAGFNFTDLQGARPKIAAADFDGDGRDDLIIGDTYGRVRFFRNAGKSTDRQVYFSNGKLIHSGNSRLNLRAADWTGDGVEDLLIITGATVSVLPNRGTPAKCEFGEPETIELPATIGGLHNAAPVDLNNDGDIDLVYHTSHRMTCYVERSFLQHGYRTADFRIAEERQK